jgi:hypothetical protein
VAALHAGQHVLTVVVGLKGRRLESIL